MRICADRFWLVICSCFVFVAVKLHLTIIVLISVYIRLHRCVRIFDLLLRISFQTDIVEKTHRISFRNSHLAFRHFIISERYHICRDHDSYQVSRL